MSYVFGYSTDTYTSSSILISLANRRNDERMKVEELVGRLWPDQAPCGFWISVSEFLFIFFCYFISLVAAKLFELQMKLCNANKSYQKKGIFE